MDNQDQIGEMNGGVSDLHKPVSIFCIVAPFLLKLGFHNRTHVGLTKQPKSENFRLIFKEMFAKLSSHTRVDNSRAKLFTEPATKASAFSELQTASLTRRMCCRKAISAFADHVWTKVRGMILSGPFDCTNETFCPEPL